MVEQAQRAEDDGFTSLWYASAVGRRPPGGDGHGRPGDRRRSSSAPRCSRPTPPIRCSQASRAASVGRRDGAPGLHARRSVRRTSRRSRTPTASPTSTRAGTPRSTCGCSTGLLRGETVALRRRRLPGPRRADPRLGDRSARAGARGGPGAAAAARRRRARRTARSSGWATSRPSSRTSRRGSAPRRSAAGRPAPRIVAGLPVAVHDDAAEARADRRPGVRGLRPRCPTTAGCSTSAARPARGRRRSSATRPPSTRPHRGAVRGRGHRRVGRRRSRSATIAPPSRQRSRRAPRGAAPAPSGRQASGSANGIGGGRRLGSVGRPSRRSRWAPARAASSGPPRALDHAVGEHVHVVGAQLVEQPVVVGDGEHAEAGLLGGRLDAAGAGAQGVDVETGVELVEDRDGRLEHAELQRLVALLLAAGQVDVHGAVQEAVVEADAPGLGEDAVGDRRPGRARGRRRRPRARRPPPRRAPRWGTAWRGTGPAWARSHGARPSRSTPSRVTDAAEHLVAGAAHDHVGQGALAGAVRAHDGVHLAGADREVDPLEDLLAGHAGAQARGSRARARTRHSTTTSTSPSTTRASYTGHRPGGGQRRGLAGLQGEGAAVLPALEGALVGAAPRPRTARCPGGCSGRRWRRRRRRCARARSRGRRPRPGGPCPSWSSSSGPTRSTTVMRSTAVSLAATAASSCGPQDRRRAARRTPRRRTRRRSGARRPGWARRGSRGRSAAPRRSGPTAEAWLQCTSLFSIWRFGTDSAHASSESLMLRLVWKALVPRASLATRMRPV